MRMSVQACITTRLYMKVSDAEVRSPRGGPNQHLCRSALNIGSLVELLSHTFPIEGIFLTIVFMNDTHLSFSPELDSPAVRE